MPGEYAFEIDSNVGRYWLAHGEGFDVVVDRGRRVGVVKNVVVNPLTREVSGVVVRRRLSAWVRGPAQVQVDDLKAVLPASRRFLVTPDVTVLARGERKQRMHARRAAARGTMVVGARHTGHAVAIAAGRARGGTLAATDHARARWPAVRRGLGAAAAWTGHALATAAALTATVVERVWRSARERLRESERKARSRARRAR